MDLDYYHRASGLAGKFLKKEGIKDAGDPKIPYLLSLVSRELKSRSVAHQINLFRMEMDKEQVGRHRNDLFSLFGFEDLVALHRSLHILVYGPDDRREVFQYSGDILASANSAVALIDLNHLRKDTGGWKIEAKSLGEGWRLCAGERFENQPAPVCCTGVLITPSLIATAGHCASGDCFKSDDDMSEFRFVFGFEMSSAGPQLNFASEQVHKGRKIVAKSTTSSSDWAVIELETKVKDVVAEPAKIRSKGSMIQTGEPIYMVGHPLGLPKKVAENAKVRLSDASSPFFLGNLDAYARNSGSPVFHMDTHFLEGILVAGNKDMVMSPEGCWKTVFLGDEEGRGETVTRISEILDVL
jgi:V8-like Glu-specific endopeptidase